MKDHLGNVRVVFNELGSTLQKTDYYPFGLEIDRNSPIQTQAVRNGINRYLFNGKELQSETGYLDFGARTYDPSIGRMTTVDRFTEKYANVSGYQYALNNPVINIDVNGDSAWKITNQWNAAFMKQFTKELASYIQKYEARKDKCTCDDLGLSVAMDFAKDNQLPFQWETESKSFDAASAEYSDFSTFSHDVKATSGAPDFQNGKNTVSVNPKDANTGSMLLNVKQSTGRAHHVQMIMGRSNDGNSLLIKQGNFTDILPAQRVWGSGDPSSMRYLGTSIQTGTYNRQTDTWRNISRGSTTFNFSKQERLIYKAFNFANWNK
ncbi:RHS repeat domain-containing protein [Dyadobacter aurulentus]|uniref:RHS repeat domain-containing protein n=1 Tax=Dyadobacter sp. UC 10 TaxID=2605428 RepID=UPI001788E1F5|nr:RHS repeat-associated core domain-containing protein [Dyadobacter sp. UC 10]